MSVYPSSDSIALSRNRSTVAQRYATISLIVVGLVFFSNWQSYQYIVLEGSITPLYYYFGAMALAGVLVWLRPHSLLMLLREPLFYWFLLYAISGLIWLVFGEGYLDPENHSWRLRFLLMLLFSAGYVLASVVDTHKFMYVLIGCAVLAAFTFWHDYLNPFLYVPRGMAGSNPGRGAGLFINANGAAGALIALSISAMPFVRKRWRALLPIVLLLGVFPTFSRSSIVFASLVAAVWLWRGQFRKSTIILLMIVAPLAATIGYEMFQTGITSAEINVDNVIGRLNFFRYFGEANDYSANERGYVAALAWEKFAEHPLSGLGVGDTQAGSAGKWGYGASTHNMFLLLLVEQGIVGGVLYLVFLGIIFLRGRRLIKYGAGRLAKDVGVALTLMALYFSFIGLFNHNMLDEPLTILVLAFLLAISHRVMLDRVTQRMSHYGSRAPYDA